MRPLLAALLLLAAVVPARADLADEVRSRARPELIKPFALDVGGVLGAASVDPGRSFGFPGFEVGVVSGLQFRPDRDDLILRDANVKAFGLPMLSAGVGLPFGLGVVAHGIDYRGVRVLGGGLRYSVFQAPVVGKALPTLGASVFADKINNAAFSAVHYSFNVSAGWALPLVTPFAGFGYDVTKVEIGAANMAGVAGLSAWARGTRLSVGADLTPAPFMRLRGAYNVLHGIPGMTLDALVKF